MKARISFVSVACIVLFLVVRSGAMAQEVTTVMYPDGFGNEYPLTVYQLEAPLLVRQSAGWFDEQEYWHPSQPQAVWIREIGFMNFTPSDILLDSFARGDQIHRSLPFINGVPIVLNW